MTIPEALPPETARTVWRLSLRRRRSKERHEESSLSAPLDKGEGDEEEVEEEEAKSLLMSKGMCLRAACRTGGG